MENKVYPTIKDTLLLCLLFIGLQAVLELCLFLGSLLNIFYIHDGSILSGLVLTATSIISFGIVLIIGFKKTKRNFLDVFKFNKISPFLWFATTVFMIGAVIMISEMDNLLNLILPMPDFLRDIFEQLMIEQTLIFAIIIIVIIPTVAEEMMYRGVILDGLSRNYTNKKAIIISGFVFGFIHLNPWQFPTAFLFGMFFAWICIKTNSILLPMYMHFFNNFLYLLAVRYRDIFAIRGFNTNFETPGEFQPLWFNITGVILLALGFFLIKKGLEKKRTTGVYYHKEA